MKTLAKTMGWSVFLLNVLMWGYLGYMRFLYAPPAPIPCTQGMTLMPGQSCFVTFEIK